MATRWHSLTERRWLGLIDCLERHCRAPLSTERGSFCLSHDNRAYQAPSTNSHMTLIMASDQTSDRNVARSAM